MALRIDGICNGKRGNYWRIIAIQSDTLYNQTIVRIALYATEEERAKDESGYLSLTSIALKGVDYDRARAYSVIRNRDEFEGSINC
jgi:hypothetical protein